jgi:hypothetical protein
VLLDVAKDEAVVAARVCDADRRIDVMLGALGDGQWSPGAESDHLDPYETLARVLWCLLREPDLPGALMSAVRMGGDTDTVAALVGGLLGCQQPLERIGADLPWSPVVQAPDPALLRTLSTGLADLRVGRAGR